MLRGWHIILNLPWCFAAVRTQSLRKAPGRSVGLPPGMGMAVDMFGGGGGGGMMMGGRGGGGGFGMPLMGGGGGGGGPPGSGPPPPVGLPGGFRGLPSLSMGGGTGFGLGPGPGPMGGPPGMQHGPGEWPYQVGRRGSPCQQTPILLHASAGSIAGLASSPRCARRVLRTAEACFRCKPSC